MDPRLRGEGNRSVFAAPQGLYACAGLDSLGQPDWLAMSVETDAQWTALAALLGRSDWASDPRFATRAGRRREHDRIDDVLAPWVLDQAQERVVERLLAAGIPCAPVTAARMGVRLDPIQKSDFIQEVDHPLAGRIPIPTQPLQFRDTGGRGFSRAAPLLGEHNAEILGGLLGLSASEIDRLRDDEIIGDRPSGL